MNQNSTMQFIQSKNGKIISALFAILILITIFIFTRDSAKVVSQVEFERLIATSEVKKLFLNPPYLYLKTEKKIVKVPAQAVDIKKLAKSFPIEVKKRGSLIYIILALLAVGAIVLIYLKTKDDTSQDMVNLTAKEGLIQEIKPISSSLKFSDVAGMSSVKEELEEIIEFLNHPKEFKKLDIRLPKGVLLIGPPGVGKTLIAKALAGEAGVPFFYQSGANIVEIYVGMGAKKINQLFQSAKKNSPSIIFIDEIDSVGKSRGALGNEEREATLNQLLMEMDGFDSNSGVIVIGATNRLDVLDEALLRPGRFDRRVYIPLPDIKEREEILKLYLKRKPHKVDISKLAHQMVGFSASALATLVNEAALFARRNKKEFITQSDFDAVKDKVISGKRKVINLSDEEKRIQAVYQSGKVLIATWFGIEFDRIGLATTMLQELDKEFNSKDEILNKIKFYLAGSVATWEVFNQKFSNASKDLALAIKEAKFLIESGMGESILSRESEIEEILESAQKETKEILKTLSRAREKIQEYLLKNENIKPQEAKRILDEIL